MTPKIGDSVYLICLTEFGKINAISISKFRVEAFQEYKFIKYTITVSPINSLYEEGFTEKFETLGFDDAGIEIGRTNAILAINPTHETIEHVKKLIFAKNAHHKNSNWRNIWNACNNHPQA